MLKFKKKSFIFYKIQKKIIFFTKLKNIQKRKGMLKRSFSKIKPKPELIKYKKKPFPYYHNPNELAAKLEMQQIYYQFPFKRIRLEY